MKNTHANEAISKVDGRVNIIGDVLFTHLMYGVYVGTVGEDDFPHYLVINQNTGVIEESNNNLAMARDIAVAFAERLKQQDEAISKGTIAERSKSSNGQQWTN